MRKRLEIILLVVFIIVSLIGTHLYITFFTPASREKVTKVMNVPKGASFRVIANNLEKAGVVRNSDSFIFIASLLGTYKKVKAGEYEFNTAMTPIEVLDFLVKGKVKKHLVTIPEGFNLKDVASALKQAGLADENEFLARATDKKFAASLALDGPTFEGYLFPDTYEFTKGMTVDEIIMKMAEKFKSVYFAEIDSAAKKKGVSMNRVVTLASIIEKETGAPNERELISAVFHNRLKKGIKLQSDPTVIYDIKAFDGNLTKKHLVTRTPYNTYVNYGLPPGPIANPGKASLKAALNPANEDYLYFVSKNDGTHFFSKNLNEHNKAVYHFQKSLKVSGVKHQG